MVSTFSLDLVTFMCVSSSSGLEHGGLGRGEG